MPLRRKTDEEDVGFSNDSDGHEIYAVAEKGSGDRIHIYEQIEGVEKDGPHNITRQVVVNEDFVIELAEQLK